mmetsp:Transcript_16758/g.36182  ORF Transcript_16758/g.36182 Transcript_16758/m.36182 type:complete len:536 (+) Transcript_16758:153-1760(+)|eukprot:CAMPEP_0172318696 /NCGR_PEP_ID=MMETSP1058-20130122/35570_1 /TAXON_ID=83371 /ORGANISM="Detonula confervacea, Strain CCMP 353" /LENGTH=535 /DNA_ID=CAMNT_0013033583 /DNA_START=57 /DNA_END=1664 /DNA_ORIENTATION=+
MSATSSSSSSIKPSVLVVTAPVAAAHQLPPIVHAIGGSIGSALAILAFYPLERVRVELQSRAGNKDSVNSEETGECNDDNQNIINEATSCTRDADDENQNENQREDMATINGMENLQMDVKDEESSSTLDSFELVAPLKSADIVSLGTLSFDEEVDNTEESPYIGLVRQARELAPKKSTTSSDIRDCTTHDRDSKPSRSKNKQDIKKPPPPHETIIQCLLRLYNKEHSLYKGASNMVTTLMISNAIFFYALQVTRRSLASLQQNNRHQQHHKGNHRPHFKHMLTYYLYHALPKSKMGISLVASSLAGAINVLLSNPLWVASLRIMEDDKLEQQQQQNLWNVMQKIVRKEGFSHLWNGTCTSLLLVSNPIIQHFIYEQLRLWLLESRRKRSGFRRKNVRGGENRHVREGNILSLKAATLSPVDALVFGALAKTAATIVTYPLQLAQVLLRLQRKTRQSSPTSNTNKSQNDSTNVIAYEGTLDCLYQQFASGGIPALFQGMNAKLLQTVLTSAFTFLTYEQTLIHVGRIYEALGSQR